MHQQIAVEIVLILLLVLANGAFAMCEMALVSARRGRLQHMVRRGNRRAAAALRLAENPDRFLSTVQIGITLIGVFAGAFAGATIAEQLDEILEEMPLFAPYSEALSMGAVVVVITYLSLILGELVPKRLALGAPERIATFVALPMTAVARFAAPAVFVLTKSTRAVLRLLGVRDRGQPPVTEEELRALIWLGAKAGTIAREERNIIERVFRLDSRRVTALMTPRIELEWLDVRKPVHELRAQVAASSHSWFPLASERVDEMVGVVRGRDLWSARLGDKGDFAPVMREPLFVPETASALSVLQRFRETRNHLAIIVDEFGGVEGIVTPTDILEALVGELPEAGDLDEPMILERADGSLSVDAIVDLQELKLALGIDYLEGEKEGFQSVGGFLVEQFHANATGQVFEKAGLRFEIVDMDGRRIDRILVSRIAGRGGEITPAP